MGLEDFIGAEATEGGMSPEAFEAFKEQMKKNAAFMQAIKRDEQKQKKKEDKLAKILLKFIKTSTKQDILLLISKLLEQNIPAVYILSLIYLGNHEIQEEINELALEAGEKNQEGKTESQTTEQSPQDAMVPFGIKDESLPLKVKIEVDGWIKNIWDTTNTYSKKILTTAIDDEQYIKPIVVKLTAFILSDFLNESKVNNDYNKIKEFCNFFLNGIIEKVQQQTYRKT